MKDKRCRQCGHKFTPRDAFDAKVRKFCSRKCYTDAKVVKRKIKICRNCGKKFEHYPHRVGTRFCSMPCVWADAKKRRVGKGNPNYRGGIWAKGGLYEHGSKTASRHLTACAKYKKNFLKKNGRIYCEVCGANQALKFETHHLYYASRYPKHPNLHDERNLILVCHECHRKFHASEMNDVLAKLERERGLKELFEEKPLRSVTG